jgi:hypothetical protein
MILLAAILFGTPGPIERRTYRDATVSATINFRVAPDRRFSGDAAPGPSVVNGTLSIVSEGKRRSYDLTNVLPTREMRIQLPTNDGECGTGRAMTRRGHYLALETVIGQKGCTSSATFIDLRTGDVVEPVFVGANNSAPTRDHVHITSVERITLKIADDMRDPSKQNPWRFIVAHGRNGRGRAVAFSYDLDAQSFIPGAKPIAIPPLGSTISLGFVREPLDFSSGRRDVNERTLALEP